MTYYLGNWMQKAEPKKVVSDMILKDQGFLEIHHYWDYLTRYRGHLDTVKFVNL